MFDRNLPFRNRTEPAPRDQGRYCLWVDSVGAFLVCLGDRVRIGGPTSDDPAEVLLLANLSRKHAAIVRCGEEYLLEAFGEVAVNERPVQGQASLTDGSSIRLGHNVRLGFRLPSALSRTACLEFQSDHRPARATEGIVLMDDTCLLGPGGENHIRCPQSAESVLLFRRGAGLWCKSRGALLVDGEPASTGRHLPPGAFVAGPELSFRLEAVA